MQLIQRLMVQLRKIHHSNSHKREEGFASVHGRCVHFLGLFSRLLRDILLFDFWEIIIFELFFILFILDYWVLFNDYFFLQDFVAGLVDLLDELSFILHCFLNYLICLRSFEVGGVILVKIQYSENFLELGRLLVMGPWVLRFKLLLFLFLLSGMLNISSETFLWLPFSILTLRNYLLPVSHFQRSCLRLLKEPSFQVVI